MASRTNVENHAYEGQSGFSRYLILLAETGKKLKINLKHKTNVRMAKAASGNGSLLQKAKQHYSRMQTLSYVSHIVSTDIFLLLILKS